MPQPRIEARDRRSATRPHARGGGGGGGGGQRLIKDLKRKANSLSRDTREASAFGLEKSLIKDLKRHARLAVAWSRHGSLVPREEEEEAKTTTAEEEEEEERSLIIA